MNVLVTGAKGFIGRYVCAELEARGHTVLPFDIQDGWDIRDPQHVQVFVEDADQIIHLAGLLGTHELYDDVQQAVAVNVGGMANLLRYNTEELPLTIIDQPHIWMNPYETTKQAAVRLARAFAKEGQYPLRVIEVHNAYGPGQAHGPGHPQKIIPTFATKAWAREPLPIWGNGHQEVNLVYVGDVAEMFADSLGWGSRDVVAAVQHTNTVNWVSGFVWGVAQGVDELIWVNYLPMRRGEDSTPLPHCGDIPFNPDRLAETVESYRPEDC